MYDLAGIVVRVVLQRTYDFGNGSIRAIKLRDRPRQNLLRLRTWVRRRGHRRSAASPRRQVLPRKRPCRPAVVARAMGQEPTSLAIEIDQVASASTKV